VKIPFFTIGHSNRSLEEFVELLSEVQIHLVADIRTVPRSRANPQFNKDTLPDALAPFDISYEHMAALGGLRGKARILSQDVNGFWTNESFHNYADYALTAQFQAGLEHLLDEGRKRRCTRTQTALHDNVFGGPYGGDVTAASSPIILSPVGRLFSTLWGTVAWSLPTLLRALSFNPAGRSSIPLRIDRARRTSGIKAD
jgi:hypothetical protein